MMLKLKGEAMAFLQYESSFGRTDEASDKGFRGWVERKIHGRRRASEVSTEITQLEIAREIGGLPVALAREETPKEAAA
jgi:hypothetical protein